MHINFNANHDSFGHSVAFMIEIPNWSLINSFLYSFFSKLSDKFCVDRCLCHQKCMYIQTVKLHELGWVPVYSTEHGKQNMNSYRKMFSATMTYLSCMAHGHLQ